MFCPTRPLDRLLFSLRNETKGKLPHPSPQGARETSSRSNELRGGERADGGLGKQWVYQSPGAMPRGNFIYS